MSIDNSRRIIDHIGTNTLGKKLFLTIVLSLLFYLIIDYASYHNIKLFTYGVFFVGLLISVINIKWGFYYYLIASILSDDTPRILSMLDKGTFTSVHTTTLGPFTMMVYWTLFMLFILFPYFVVKRKTFKLQKMDKYMFGLIILYLIAGAIGILNLVKFPRIYMSDFSYLINMAIFYFFVRIVLKRESELKKVISLIILCYGIKTVVALFYYFLGIGFLAGQNVRVIFESGSSLMGLIFFLCLCLLLYLPKMRWQYRVLLYLFGFTSLFNLITYASRGNIILFLVSFLLLLIFFGKGKFGKLVRGRAIVTVGLVTVLSLTVVHAMRPGALRYVAWKINTTRAIDFGDPRVSSASTRILEGINIFNTLLEDGIIIWGGGLGSYFSDKYYPYSFGLLGGAAYPDEHILSGKLFTPHGTELVILLKMGIGGLLFYYFIMLLFFKEGYVIFKQVNDKYWKAVALAILVFMPLFFYKNFISKLQVFFGITLAILPNIQALWFRKFISRDRI